MPWSAAATRVAAEELEPLGGLLDLDPLAVDQEAVAPGAHLQEVAFVARRIGIEQRLRLLALLLGAQAGREKNHAAAAVGSDADVHLAAWRRGRRSGTAARFRTPSRTRRSSSRCSFFTSWPATNVLSERPRLSPAPSQPFSSAKR